MKGTRDVLREELVFVMNMVGGVDRSVEVVGSAA